MLLVGYFSTSDKTKYKIKDNDKIIIPFNDFENNNKN